MDNRTAGGEPKGHRRDKSHSLRERMCEYTQRSDGRTRRQYFVLKVWQICCGVVPLLATMGRQYPGADPTLDGRDVASSRIGAELPSLPRGQAVCRATRMVVGTKTAFLPGWFYMLSPVSWE